MKRFAPSLTYANVVATLALFIAVGGTSAYAANQLSANSVGTKQLKNGAVTQAKLANSAQGERGPEGKQGPLGPQGSPGPPGQPDATHAVVRLGPRGGYNSVAKCEPGEVATGGGGFIHSEEAGQHMASSTPVQDAGETPTEWEVSGEQGNGTPAEAEAYVVCVSP